MTFRNRNKRARSGIVILRRGNKRAHSGKGVFRHRNKPADSGIVVLQYGNKRNHSGIGLLHNGYKPEDSAIAMRFIKNPWIFDVLPEFHCIPAPFLVPGQHAVDFGAVVLRLDRLDAE
ncbi:MAG: hypothetical protein HZA91_17530 [Verrucomicrobia bacterium]|nr:hypothetical protein [Verrucomicrobiota bacterium]